MQVLANARALAARMSELGYKIVSGGTDNHLILVDLKPAGIDGARVQQVRAWPGCMAWLPPLLQQQPAARLRPTLRLALPPLQVLDMVHITLNKNSVPGDQSAVVPGGIRIGTPALTTRGFREADFVRVADFLHRGIQIAQDCKAQTPAPGKLKEFAAYLAGPGAGRDDIKQLAKEVHDFAASFAMPGGDW